MINAYGTLLGMCGLSHERTASHAAKRCRLQKFLRCVLCLEHTTLGLAKRRMKREPSDGSKHR
eukprot:6183768-Pleurochrysis_carterae.AAC.4